MRYLLVTAGNFTFEDEPVNKGLIGGRIIATNLETGHVVIKPYIKYHSGQTTKYSVLTDLMMELAPPPQNEEKEEE